MLCATCSLHLMISRSVIAASRSRSSYTSRRAFTHCSRLGQARQDGITTTLSEKASEKGKEKEKQIAGSTVESLYENSRAAHRPRANATSALYTGQLVVKGRYKASKRLQGSKLSTLHEAEDEQDDLTELLHELADERGIRDIFSTIETCRKIKRYMKQSNDETGRNDAAPYWAYRGLIEKLAPLGSYHFASQLVDEMEAVGHEPDLIILNHLLEAAVLNGDEENVTSALTRIAKLPYKVAQRLDKLFVDDEADKDQRLLSPEWTRNWNYTTYSHMLHRCRLSHNAELALALIASASQRRRPNDETNPYLRSVLHQPGLTDVIAVLAHVREARLTVELAQWLDRGYTARKTNPQTWMTILHLCADQLYHPGIIIAWENAVELGLLIPDEGIIISALNSAGRIGDISFVEQVLSFYQAKLAMTHGPLREWHLLPKFQAQWFNDDFEGAFRTATAISRLSGAGLRADKLSAIKEILVVVPEALDRAYDAFIKVGRDPSSEGGICLAILNNLLKAANAQNRSDMLLKIYRSRDLVRNEQAPANVELPLHRPLLRGEDERSLLTEEDANANRNVEDEAVKAKHTLIPDVVTFNELFYCALKLKDVKMSEIVRRHLNRAGVKGNERTYELAVRIELLKSDYENVFTLLEECKKRLMIPTGWMYTHIARRCIQEDDRRWIEVGKEMLENEYPMPVELLSLMIKGGHYVPDKRSRDEEENR